MSWFNGIEFMGLPAGSELRNPHCVPAGNPPFFTTIRRQPGPARLSGGRCLPFVALDARLTRRSGLPGRAAGGFFICRA